MVWLLKHISLVFNIQTDNANILPVDLEKRKEEAVKSLKEFSHRLTGPSDLPEYSPRHKYTLRGVCTLPHVMYVLRRDESQPDGTDMDVDANNWQWWRISFSVEDGAARMAEASQQPAVPSSVEEPSSKTQETKRRRISIPSNTDVMGYAISRVREVEVLRAAKEESSTVLLVYASEDAVNFKEDALPPALQVCMILFKTKIRVCLANDCLSRPL